MPAMDFGDWIRDALRRNPSKTQAGLASALGRNASSVSRMLKGGRQVKASELSKIVTYLGESPPPGALADLISAAGPAGFGEAAVSFAAAPRPGLIDVAGTELAAVPRYDAKMSAGPGSIIDADAEPIGHWYIEAQWLRAITQTAPSRLAVLRVAGDSMEDTLADGDWVLVDRGQTRAAQEGIYALQIDDTTWVKRLSLNLRERLIRVISDNPRYPVQELPADDLTVIGRIVWIVARKV